MKIDILSDLHFDYYFKQIYSSKVDVRKTYDKYFLKDGREIGDVLVVAGDLGHNNQQNISLLDMIKRIYGYKAIICVLGNHDYCLVNRIMEDDYDDSFARADEMKKLINDKEGIYCLDGDVIEIDGIRFGGAMGWYSSAFSRTYFPLAGIEGMNGMWKVLMPEGKQFKGIKNFDDPYKIELPKIEAVYQKCDVMITHINPSFLAEHISQEYRNNRSTTFYCFNGHEFLKNTTAKHWIFGHTHSSYSYEFEGVQCHVNAYELYKSNMKSIEI
ncbi:MAG: metallophosphoesterase [Thiovulaceae bacterium]|nr:metallophosphoesterase [Sulfurimonadaceae bacterium]